MKGFWIDFIRCVFLAIAFSIIMHVLIAMVKVNQSDLKTNYEEGYLDACKDSYQGKLKYTLIENPDGTKEWRKIK